MQTIGIVHGRFQVLHLDHLKYILAASQQCDYLLIGISNPDPSLTQYDPTDPHRSKEDNNPLTYFERQQMIRLTLEEAGLARERFDIVPFPINRPEILFHYVPKDAIFFITIYDAWGEAKQKLLESLGCQVQVLWRKTEQDKMLSGSDIRQRIKEGRDWKLLVPNAVYTYLTTNNLTTRMKPQAHDETR